MNVFSAATPLVSEALVRPDVRPAFAAESARRARRPWAHLLNAVLELAGPHAELVSHAERPWASVTFNGSRHTVTLVFNGVAGVVAGEAFAGVVTEHEFAIPRQIVADAQVTGMLRETRPARLTVETDLLLVEDF